MTNNSRSAYETWSWPEIREKVLSLRGRLGYDQRLWILGFELRQDGVLYDLHHQRVVYDPVDPLAAEVPVRHSGAPEMFCLLTRYASAPDIPLSGEWVSWASLDVVRRPELRPEECQALLAYDEMDVAQVDMGGQPFFGERMAGGDLAFEVCPFPRVPVSFILWRGDGEVPAGGTLRFDNTARFYLGNLLRELAWLTVWRLRNLLDPDLRWGEAEPD
jgi:hypothetical protein